MAFVQRKEGNVIGVFVSSQPGYAEEWLEPDSSELVTWGQKRAWENIRMERNARLAACDWTQLPDADPPGGAAVWAEFRQALRDIPQKYDLPGLVIWPEKPGI